MATAATSTAAAAATTAASIPLRKVPRTRAFTLLAVPPSPERSPASPRSVTRQSTSSKKSSAGGGRRAMAKAHRPAAREAGEEVVERGAVIQQECCKGVGVFGERGG